VPCATVTVDACYSVSACWLISSFDVCSPGAIGGVLQGAGLGTLSQNQSSA
jgi:hypothetical protein